MKITLSRERFPLRVPFTISRGTRTHAEVLRVVVEKEGRCGIGECTPYPRYGESFESVEAEILSVADQLIDRQQLQSLLPPGAARNALDAALWRLESELSYPENFQCVTALTVSLNTPMAMAKQAKEYVEQGAQLLKVKLDGEAVYARMLAVREAAPSARIVVDANEAWSELDLVETFSQMASLGVEMIEQPLPANHDALLAEMPHPVKLCADESCHSRQELDALAGRYEMINIKLDKTGGLTEALLLAQAARERGLEVMMGCMLGSSLAMEMAVPIAKDAVVVDLDGPALLTHEDWNLFDYHHGVMSVAKTN
ncbi:N-acetyl-D-Glu racemase DgcA [Thaumasiovibrio subtropicus]|uniref:N-acetyl-D-Glu racemase DgcA n=1 Tax=Thaumasiovibrio subtropicus TaxID=1891207 RepID=UPI000B35C6A3|nr:N-acetyl-D-Glu racemase DgcA [Thaumasiovibrio subtropicus]